jgi:GMP synthase (glutamine-hydrolysing)
VKRALAVRHVHFEDLGIFGPVLAERGYEIAYANAGLDDLAAVDEASVDLLAILGAPIGAYEDALYPFLKDEIGLIEQRLASGRPLLGICLGAQLIARAMGAVVRPGPAKEIGWAPVALTEAGRASPLRHLGAEPVLHWHGDMFELPSGAERLAATEICPNQAFAYGRSVLGVQFHPEVDPARFERWLIGHAAEIAGAGLSPIDLRAATARHGAGAVVRGRRLIEDWLGGLPI